MLLIFVFQFFDHILNVFIPASFHQVILLSFLQRIH